jgi:sugar O-acyltransferase (sialic acid O-acetyltransferase NeuD family)
MHNNKILLYGASGHAKVICSICESLSLVVQTIFDDNINIYNLHEYIVKHKYDQFFEQNTPLLISIGNNKIRKMIASKIVHKFTNLVHPTSAVDINVNFGVGNVVFQNATIQRDTLIGNHCIINTNSSVDHDCILNDFVHISPSATLCGNVSVGEGTHIGAAATVIPNTKIGKWCIVGAGAVITEDVPDYSLVVGVPGKIIKTFKDE